MIQVESIIPLEKRIDWLSNPLVYFVSDVEMSMKFFRSALFPKISSVLIRVLEKYRLKYLQPSSNQILLNDFLPNDVILSVIQAYQTESLIKEHESEIILCCQCLAGIRSLLPSGKRKFLNLGPDSNFIDKFVDLLINIESVLGSKVYESIWQIFASIVSEMDSKTEFFASKITPLLQMMLEFGIEEDLPGLSSYYVCQTIYFLATKPIFSRLFPIISFKSHIIKWLEKYPSQDIYLFWMNALLNLCSEHHPQKHSNSEVLTPIFSQICVRIQDKFGFDIRDDQFLLASIGCFSKQVDNNIQSNFVEIIDFIGCWFDLIKKTHNSPPLFIDKVVQDECVTYWSHIVSVISFSHYFMPQISPKYDSQMEWCVMNGGRDEDFSVFIMNCYPRFHKWGGLIETATNCSDQGDAISRLYSESREDLAVTLDNIFEDVRKLSEISKYYEVVQCCKALLVIQRQLIRTINSMESNRELIIDFEERFEPYLRKFRKRFCSKFVTIDMLYCDISIPKSIENSKYSLSFTSDPKLFQFHHCCSNLQKIDPKLWVNFKTLEHVLKQITLPKNLPGNKRYNAAKVMECVEFVKKLSCSDDSETKKRLFSILAPHLMQLIQIRSHSKDWCFILAQLTWNNEENGPFEEISSYDDMADILWTLICNEPNQQIVEQNNTYLLLFMGNISCNVTNASFIVDHLPFMMTQNGETYLRKQQPYPSLFSWLRDLVDIAGENDSRIWRYSCIYLICQLSSNSSIVSAFLESEFSMMEEFICDEFKLIANNSEHSDPSSLSMTRQRLNIGQMHVDLSSFYNHCFYSDSSSIVRELSWGQFVLDIRYLECIEETLSSCIVSSIYSEQKQSFLAKVYNVYQKYKDCLDEWIENIKSLPSYSIQTSDAIMVYVNSILFFSKYCQSIHGITLSQPVSTADSGSSIHDDVSQSPIITQAFSPLTFRDTIRWCRDSCSNSKISIYYAQYLSFCYPHISKTLLLPWTTILEELSKCTKNSECYTLFKSKMAVFVDVFDTYDTSDLIKAHSPLFELVFECLYKFISFMKQITSPVKPLPKHLDAPQDVDYIDFITTFLRPLARVEFVLHKDVDSRFLKISLRFLQSISPKSPSIGFINSLAINVLFDHFLGIFERNEVDLTDLLKILLKITKPNVVPLQSKDKLDKPTHLDHIFGIKRKVLELISPFIIQYVHKFKYENMLSSESLAPFSLWIKLLKNITTMEDEHENYSRSIPNIWKSFDLLSKIFSHAEFINNFVEIISLQNKNGTIDGVLEDVFSLFSNIRYIFPSWAPKIFSLLSTISTRTITEDDKSFVSSTALLKSDVDSMEIGQNLNLLDDWFLSIFKKCSNPKLKVRQIPKLELLIKFISDFSSIPACLPDIMLKYDKYILGLLGSSFGSSINFFISSYQRKLTASVASLTLVSLLHRLPLHQLIPSIEIDQVCEYKSSIFTLMKVVHLGSDMKYKSFYTNLLSTERKMKPFVEDTPGPCIVDVVPLLMQCSADVSYRTLNTLPLVEFCSPCYGIFHPECEVNRGRNLRALRQKSYDFIRRTGGCVEILFGEPASHHTSKLTHYPPIISPIDSTSNTCFVRSRDDLRIQNIVERIESESPLADNKRSVFSSGTRKFMEKWPVLKILSMMFFAAIAYLLLYYFG
ncbi:hypothetical protein ADUPG1_006369 [Aduncisulcus paluster]|uniref:Uncharacterized protein n=1 Tax=Aduncisulcus paluster TaxID=2918883 RepID=A0ABQ5KI13_9EUKA|nr:hypothetical protein ADUPG1_006369 [Aduncisulcus paluster]